MFLWYYVYTTDIEYGVPVAFALRIALYINVYTKLRNKSLEGHHTLLYCLGNMSGGLISATV